jgi:hypothetical protein
MRVSLSPPLRSVRGMIVKELSRYSRAVTAGFAVALLLCACTTEHEEIGALQTDTKSVALGGAKSEHVAISMGAGELKVTGGSQPGNQLMDATFTYNVPRWKPEVTYNVSGEAGELEVKQPESGHTIGNTRNEWELHLNNKIPTDIEANLGAGKANLTLGGMALRSLKVDMGAGEATVDLTGDWKNNLSAQVHGGVGKAVVRLPQDVGVHVIAHGGLGAINANGFQKQGDAYVNEAYGKSPITLNIEVEGGVGEIDLELGEAPPVV